MTTPNFYKPSLKHAGEGLCDAITRREAKTCAFYRESANGWCAHTRKDYHYDVPDKPDAYGNPRRKEVVVKGMVSGVCMSAAAAESYSNSKEKMGNGTETTCQ